MSMSRDFGRRESVMVIPSMDSVLDGYGRSGGPMDRRDVTFTFRVVGSDQDAAYDLLAAQVAPGVPQRLVYQPDNPVAAPWFTIGSNPRIQHTLTAAGRGLVPHCDFTVTWRIRPDWRKRFSETAEVFRAGTTFAAGTHFGNVGTVTIAANPQNFTVDARGTAGSDLPTLPDTGPTITLTGPCGGSSGIQVSNYSATVRDTAGALQPTYFIIPFPLPTASDTVTLKCASQTFLHNGAPFRPYKPPYQRLYFTVMPGVVNNCAVGGAGAGVALGGSIKTDWIRRRA